MQSQSLSLFLSLLVWNLANLAWFKSSSYINIVALYSSYFADVMERNAMDAVKE